MSATLSAIPEPIAKRSDERKIARNRALLLLGHEGVMLDKVQQQANHLLNLAKQAAGGSATDKQSEAPEEEEQMGVNIGNETHNHFDIQMKVEPEAVAAKPPASPPASPPAIPAPIAAIPAAIAPANPLLAAVLGGALVIGGAAVGALWPSGDSVNTDTDTDTTYELHLPP